MKKLLLFAALVAIPFLGKSQIFQEDFDGAGPGIAAWTLIDVDAQVHNTAVSQYDAGAWIRVDRGGPIPNYGGPDGNYAAASSSWYTPAGASNDWLITPSITLPAAAAMLKWDSKAQDPSFSDGYKVMLAPNGGNTVADFTVTLFTIPAENSAWITRTVSLAPYVGTTVRIAFVNNSNDMFVLLMDNISVELAPTSAPNCATQVSPANAATGVNYVAAIPLTWTAPTTGSAPTSYDVFLGTAPNPATLLGNVPGLTINATGLLASTTYYWKVIAKNAAGSATGCSEFMFTTSANPFAPYCGPLAFTSNVEPITLVNFAGINNTSPAATGGTAHENYTSIVGNVSQGGSYLITLKGNTDGGFTNRFVVFIDWNQNGVLDDAGEVYAITQTILGSTGVDAIQATQTLAVPATAMVGNTRMRVKKIFGTTNYLNPCLGSGFGQAEDYTITVASLAVNDNLKNAIKVYPNPVVDVLNIESPNKVKQVTVFDATGRSVSSHVLNATKSQVNLRRLTPGVYVVNIEMENETKTVKVIKK